MNAPLLVDFVRNLYSIKADISGFHISSKNQLTPSGLIYQIMDLHIANTGLLISIFQQIFVHLFPDVD